MATDKKWIPKEWTFQSRKVSDRFEKHVREQLPWYDLATAAVAHVARHYIPNHGVVYDIGASTGNIGLAIADLLDKRKCAFTAIEESPEMAVNYRGPSTLKVCDAMAYEYDEFDFAICFLVLMFMPVRKRESFVGKLRAKIAPGGALVVVDKINTPGGYAGTCIRRMAMKWKLDAGTNADDVLAKELSLAGYQRPINPSILGSDACQWFQFGEFAGWIIERPE